MIDANASVVFEDVIAALRVAADKARDPIMMTHAESVDKPFANAPFCALQKDVPVMFDAAAAALEGGEQRDDDEFYAVMRTWLLLLVDDPRKWVVLNDAAVIVVTGAVLVSCPAGERPASDGELPLDGRSRAT